MELVEVNGETGLCVRTDGVITAVLSIVSDGERIHEVYVVVNPEKISHQSAVDSLQSQSAGQSSVVGRFIDATEEVTEDCD
jgi:hypothetical protein